VLELNHIGTLLDRVDYEGEIRGQVFVDFEKEMYVFNHRHMV